MSKNTFKPSFKSHSRKDEPTEKTVVLTVPLADGTNATGYITAYYSASGAIHLDLYALDSRIKVSVSHVTADSDMTNVKETPAGIDISVSPKKVDNGN